MRCLAPGPRHCVRLPLPAPGGPGNGPVRKFCGFMERRSGVPGQDRRLSTVAEAPPPPQAPTDGLRRGAAFALATQLVTAAGTAVLTLYLVRALGPREFGVFSLAVSVGTLLVLPADAGISQSASRFVAERLGDHARIAAVLATGLRLKLVVNGVVSAALFAGAGPIAQAYAEPSLTWPIRWMALAVAGQSLLLFYRGAFAGMRRLSIAFRVVACESAAETLGSIALVILGTGAAGAAAGRAAGYGVGAGVAIAATWRIFGRRAFARPAEPRGLRRTLMRYAGALFVIDAAFTASTQLAPLFIGAFLGSRAVGVFQAPVRLLVFLQYPGLALATAVAPRLAREEDRAAAVRSFEVAMRRLIVFQGLVLALLVVWAGPIAALALGSDYGESADVLRVMAPYAFMAGLAPLASLAVNYLGEARLRVPISLADLVLGVVLTVVLLPALGVLGAAVAADVGALFYVPLHLWICRRMVGVRLGRLALTGARTLAAAGAMALVLAAFGTGALSAWQWLGGAVAGSAAFALVLRLTGELRAGELRALGRALVALLPGRP